MFYVENWSLTLDIAIIIATIKHVMLRVVKKRIMARANRNAAASSSTPASVATD
jgi:lipopolysaccharide/colanic/teichoic acid biosynthesis glycosyltransferase